MKINKKLSAAITLGLMLGMYGSASAADLYGTDLARDASTSSISTAEVERGSTTGVTTDVNKAHNSEHTFTVLSGTWNDIYGGHGAHGDFGNVGANLNSVTIAGSNVKADTVYGGYNISATGKSNSVTISGTNAEITNNVYGIYIETIGLAYINTVNISSGTVGGNVYGGNTGIGNAEANTVKITGSIIGSSTSDTGNVYGGWSENGEATNNTIEIKNAKIGTSSGPVTGLVYGGYVKNNGNVTGNKVTVSGNSEIYTSVNGGRAAGSKGDAIGNTVNITGDTTKGVYIHAGVTGGFSANGLAKDNLVGTSDKRATNFTAREVHGGYGSTGAEGNEVYLSVGSNVTEDVYGGRTTNGIAGGDNAEQSNKVTITGGTVGSSVYGGYSVNGAAINNEVYMSNNSTSAYVFGGYGTTANKNIVTIISSNITSKTVGAGNIYGGYGKKDGAAQNEVTLNNILASGDVYGGYAVKGNAGGKDTSGNSLGNTVTITGGHIGYQYNAESGKYDGVYGNSGTTHLGNVYGGYVKEEGNADNNNVLISGGDIFGSVYGGKTANGSASGNKVGNSVSDAATNFTAVNVYGGQGTTGATGNEVWLGAGVVIAENVYGGQDGTSASNNIVNINGGTTEATKVQLGTIKTDGKYKSLTGHVYGGFSSTGEANNNKVGTADNAATNFTGNVIYGAWGTNGATGNEVWLGTGVVASSVTGGYAGAGNATKNKVNLSGGLYNENSVTGGYAYGTKDGNFFANENEVKVTNGSIVEYGIIGGSAHYAEASNNKVTVIDSYIGAVGTSSSFGDVYGAHVWEANANGNQVDISGNSVITAGVYGGYVQTKGAANNNNVVISGPTKVVDSVYGGYTASGEATSNTVTISGGNIEKNVTGGYSGTGNAIKNTVTISGDSSVNGLVYGGRVYTSGNAESNAVTISGGAITSETFGGYTKTGTAASNTVSITTGNLGNVTGGYVNEGGAANSNTVVVEGGNIGSVTGGEVFTTASGFDNTANSNTVTISGGEIVGDVIGGAAKSGNLTRVKGFANSNNIEISKNAVIRGDVKGGHTVIGDAASNEIAISDSAKVIWDVYGAFIQTKGDAANNEIAVSGGEVGGIVYGGYTKEGTAESNAVTISGGTIGSSSKFVYGGYTKEGKATSNTVTISNGTINSVVIGGHDASVADSEKFTDGNKVIISGGTVNNAVYGGSSANNNALNNSVEISGSSTQITGNVYGGSSWGYDGIAKGNKVDVKNGTLNKNVYGGFSGADNVEENTVNISGGTIGGNVYGGESADGTANDNIVNISGTADISTAEVYGGKGTSAGTGNTLNIDTWTGSKTMKSINDFQAINVKDTREITVGDAAGLAEGGVVLDIQDSTLNLSTMGKSEKVVYLTSSGSDDFSTKFSSAKLNGYGQGEGIWRGVTTGYGVDASKAAFQIDKTQAFASVTENLLTGNLVDEGVTEELVLGSSAATFDNIYGAYSEIGTATAATVNMNVKDADLSSSTVWGNNVSADGNALKVSATGIVVKELKNFETIEADLSAGVANGDKVLTVNGEVDVKDVAISGLDAASLNKGDSVEVLNATNIKGVPAYTLDGTAVADGDIKGYTSTNANGVNVDRVAFAADTTKVALTKEDTLLTGKYIDKDGAETVGTLVLDSGAAKYDNIYGAYAENGAASPAVVNMDAAANLSSSTIYGNNINAAGNTLNVRATGNKVGGVEYFENMNFYIPDTAAAGDTMLSVNSAVDLTGVNVAAGFHNDTTLGYGDKVILIDAPSVSGMDGVSEVKVDDTDFTEYDVMVYQGDAGMNQVETGTATTLVAEMANMELKENSKVLLETVMAAATVINDGSDLLAGKTFDSAASAIAADLETGAPSGKMSLFGAMSGNKSKVKTGSHVDVEGWNMNLGFAKELKNKNGKMILGPVVEYGRGNYDSYLDNSYHAKGDSHYVGGGFMAKQINTDGNYFEGSLRMGKVTSDFKSTGGSYDTDAKYLAGHIGVGRVQKLDAKNSMDYYAKFFHTHMDGDEVKVHAKGKDLDLTLDRSNSSRLRIGTRLNHLLGEKSAYYVGFAWQHEFSGLASGALAGKEIVSPSVKGHTGFMEMGVKLFSANQYDLDLGAIGSVGKKKGAGINLNFNFKF